VLFSDLQYVLILYPRLIVTGHEMDVRALSFEDASFDIAIDKGRVLAHGFSSGLM